MYDRFLSHPPLLTYVRREQSNRPVKKTVQPTSFHKNIKVFYYQLMHKRIALKGLLKFTLKLPYLQHVSV
jgi:hypothetical protein